MSDPGFALHERYARAETLDAYVARAEHHRDFWRSMRVRAAVPREVVERARGRPAAEPARA